jgi:hypothetical protein
MGPSILPINDAVAGPDVDPEPLTADEILWEAVTANANRALKALAEARTNEERKIICDAWEAGIPKECK